MKKIIYFLFFMVFCNVEVMAQDRATIIRDIKKSGAVYLSNFGETIRGDREIVLIAVNVHGMALEYAVDTLKKDKKIVMAAVKNDSSALKYAHESLKKDKEVVLAAVKLHPYSIRYADKSLQQDKTFLTQIEKQKSETLAQINKPSKKYQGKIYKAKKRTCWQYNTADLVAWNSWVAPGKKRLAKNEVKSIKEFYIWIKKQTSKEKYIALVVKMSDRVYRHNFILCYKEKSQFTCAGECDSGQLQLRKGMQMHLETLDFIVEDTGGPRAELVLEQRQKNTWLKPKKVTCPEYVVEGLTVCYDNKIIDTQIKYVGCIRSHIACEKIGKRHFGAYPNDNSAQSAYYRCEQNQPKK